ncbi:hypothetical protein [Nocardioides panaciterrulae]|uniref:DUF4064 domain-containing protein n=1 Tax=Nocardioides panaciterrulae TaxID=661492 RepID=A0A7Y9J9P2_9ACTN|nr:hypothetical protein [Nocardioides panaciterrulae]NYD40311.1 hypothetical protein [Nocardioides panaciterrulae]
MSSPSRPPAAPARPRQVTLAATLIMGGSVLLVLTAFERMNGLHSLETQQAVRDFVGGPPGSDLGISAAGVLDALRVVCLVAAGCATAAAILGFEVLRRNRAARVVLTVLAAPLFLSGLVTGGFLSSVVAAASVMLWLQPSRDWFRGIPTAAAPAASGARTRPGAGATPGEAPGSTGTPAHVAWPPQPWERTEHLPRLATEPGVRPPALAWACGLAWLFAGLTAVLMTASIALLATSPDAVFAELHRQDPQLAEAGLGDDVLRTATFVLGGVLVVWSVVAVVVAVLAFRRVRWARIALLVSALASAGCCLLASVGQFLMLVPLAASVVAVALLVRPDVKAWFDRR